MLHKSPTLVTHAVWHRKATSAIVLEIGVGIRSVLLLCLVWRGRAGCWMRRAARYGLWGRVELSLGKETVILVSHRMRRLGELALRLPIRTEEAIKPVQMR